MSKFHINKKGVPSPCRAKNGNCPLGGDSQHFPTKESAEEFVANEMSKKHGLLGGVLNRAEVLPFGEDGFADFPLDEEFLESEEVAENCINWANSEEAEKFLKTGELEGVYYSEADLIKSYIHYIGPYSHGYGIGDEISDGVDGLCTTPPEEIQKEVINAISSQGIDVKDIRDEIKELNEKQKSLLEEAGQIEDANHRMFDFFNYDEMRHETFDLDTHERIVIDEYEYAAALLENPWKENIVETMRDGSSESFVSFAGGTKSLAEFFKRKIGTPKNK